MLTDYVKIEQMKNAIVKINHIFRFSFRKNLHFQNRIVKAEIVVWVWDNSRLQSPYPTLTFIEIVY